MTKLFIALAAGLVAIAPASAKDKKPVDPNKKICRSEAPTGSFIPKSTCHTAAEWASIDAANQASTRATLDGTTRTGGAH